MNMKAERKRPTTRRANMRPDKKRAIQAKKKRTRADGIVVVKSTDKKKKTVKSTGPRRIRRVKRKKESANDAFVREMHEMTLLEESKRPMARFKLFLDAEVNKDKKKVELKDQLDIDMLSFLNHITLSDKAMLHVKRSFLSMFTNLNIIVEWPLTNDLFWFHVMLYRDAYPTMIHMVKSAGNNIKYVKHIHRYGKVVSSALIESVRLCKSVFEKKSSASTTKTVIFALSGFLKDLTDSFHLLGTRITKEPPAKKGQRDVLGKTIGEVVWLLENTLFGLAYISCCMKLKCPFIAYIKQRKQWANAVSIMKFPKTIVSAFAEFPKELRKLEAGLYQRCSVYYPGLELIKTI